MKQFRSTTKRFSFLLYLVLLFPLLVGIIYFGGYNNAASAAITVDTHNAPPDTVSVKSWSHTVSNQPNRILIVGIIEIVDTNTRVTFNGQSLTRHYTNTSCASCITSIYYLKNPPVGTYTINVSTLSEMSAVSVSLYNVDLNTPFGSVNSSINYGPVTPMLTLTNTNASQRIINYVGVLGTTTSISPTTGQTFLREHNNPQAAGMHSYLAIANGNTPSTQLNWTAIASSGIHVNVGLAVNPAIMPTTTPIPPTNTPVPTATPIPPSPTPPSTTTNIIDLNFGINNLQPWIQTICGDIRMDSGLINKQPLGQYTSITNPSCVNPGIVFSGNTTPDFGQGQSSITGWSVGNSSYPETYGSSSENVIFSSYDNLFAKSQSADNAPIDLESVCNVTNCTLPIALPQGIYFASRDVTLDATTFLPNRHYVFLIDGNLTLRGNILTSNNGTTFFSASGNILIPPTVGNPAAISTTNLSGVFSTDKSFIMQSNNNCTDLRLNITGVLIVNAARTGGILQNDRDLCGANATAPTLQMTQSLDMILNLPEFLRIQQIVSQEVDP